MPYVERVLYDKIRHEFLIHEDENLFVLNKPANVLVCDDNVKTIYDPTDGSEVKGTVARFVMTNLVD